MGLLSLTRALVSGQGPEARASMPSVGILRSDARPARGGGGQMEASRRGHKAHARLSNYLLLTAGPVFPDIVSHFCLVSDHVSPIPACL